VPYGVVRTDEVVVEEAFLPDGPGEPLRFVADVDVVALARMAPTHSQVAELCAAYARRHGAIALPNLLKALSVLIARGVLVESVPTSLSAV
jgi:hypothetical protein